MQNLILRNKELRQLNYLKSFAILFLCVFLYIISPYITLLLILIPFFLFKNEGVEFNFKQHQVRNYKSFFLKRIGTWKNIKEFDNIVILNKDGKKSTTGTMMVAQHEIKLNYFELYLMNEFHTRRFFIYSTTSKSRIKEISKLLEEKTNLPIKSFNPQTNKATSKDCISD